MQNEKDIVLKTTGLSLAYGHQTVLEDVNIEIGSGEFWFFLGANGEGKTTLLRAILGLLQPRAGQLWLRSDLARRERIGLVPQRCDLNPTLSTTVREFVLLGLVGIRVSRKERKERLSWALEKVGLGGMAERDYWSLSGGQRQRTLLARALVRRPTLLILDEPTNGLDFPTRESLLQSLDNLNQREQLTLLFVTHDLTIPAHYGTHIALFRGGRVQAGPSQEVLNPANLERAYGVPIEIYQQPSRFQNTQNVVKGVSL